eukprot:440171-Alexandrium_andersonii.AAC.1
MWAHAARALGMQLSSQPATTASPPRAARHPPAPAVEPPGRSAFLLAELAGRDGVRLVGCPLEL